MIPASVMSKLATLGLTADQAAEIATMLADVEAATEGKANAAIEARRANDRDRKARQRHGKSRDITGRNVTERDGADPSPKERSPTPPKEITPSRSSSLRSDDSAPSPNAENLGATAPSARQAKPARAKPKTQIADDAQPDERQRADAAEAGLANDLFRAEWRKFRDYHRSKGSLMADWQAAWRTWLGNVAGFQPRTGPPRPPTAPNNRNGFHAFLNEAENEQSSDHHVEIADRAATARDVTPRRDDLFEAGSGPQGALALHR